MIWTDELIKELINCPKVVLDPPKDIGKINVTAAQKKTFTFASLDGLHKFSGFIMQNKHFAENFSIGLIYHPKDERGGVIILRCNGKHGGTKQHPHHAAFHIHYATADRINAGLKPEGDIRVSEEYSTLDSALEYFVNLVQVVPAERQKFLPEKKQQGNLFENEY